MEPILITLINLGVILSFILYCVADLLVKSKQIIDYLHKNNDNAKNNQSTQQQQSELFSDYKAYETTPNMVKRLDKEAKKLEREEKENDM